MLILKFIDLVIVCLIVGVGDFFRFMVWFLYVV